MIKKGFRFANVHSSEHELYIRSDNRTISPSVRKNEFIIPGRHGTIDYGLNTYEKRFITMILYLVNKEMEDLRQQARDVAYWLSKEGMLVFDDEPEKAYQAKVYESIDIEEIMGTGNSTVVFECQPLAESLEYRQVFVPSITTNSYETPLNVNGTAEACPIITIKNTGTTTINNITITRKVEI